MLNGEQLICQFAKIYMVLATYSFRLLHCCCLQAYRPRAFMWQYFMGVLVHGGVFDLFVI